MPLIFAPELRCTAGQAEKPTRETCERHPAHYWCKTCKGWYGVPHDFGMHDPGNRHDGVSFTRGCACRPCRTREAELYGPGPHLWPCGCLKNNAGAHRVGCPDHPERVRGT